MTRPSARRTFIVLAAVLLPAMVAASYWFGVTWDEKSRHAYGEQVWRYLTGELARSDFTSDGSQLYGGFFDVLAVAAERVLPFNRYVLRHGLDAVFGWLGVVYAGRLAGRLFGGWSGVLALVLLAASPRYFAHSMNNPKDLPFAALTVVGLYYISTISPRWPYISTRTLLTIAVPLALALNIRAAALLYLGYAGLLVVIFVVREGTWTMPRLVDTAGRLAAMAAGTLLLGTVFWPWAQGNPFVRPIQAAMGLSDFPYAGTVLFAGREYDAGALPRYYAPWYFLITTPPVVLAGLALSLVPTRDRAKQGAALWGVAALPVILAVARHSTLYDGIRHLLFVYPVLAVLAAGGWQRAVAAGRSLAIRRIAAATLAAGLAGIAVFHLRAFPNEAAYFNAIVGGPRGAFAKYDQDYWGNCIQQAVSWSAAVARLSRRPVGVSGNAFQIVQLDAERYPELFYAPPTSIRHHLDIRLNRGPIDGVTELAGRGDALYRVAMPDGAILCVVLPGPAFDDLKRHLVEPEP